MRKPDNVAVRRSTAPHRLSLKSPHAGSDLIHLVWCSARMQYPDERAFLMPLEFHGPVATEPGIEFVSNAPESHRANPSPLPSRGRTKVR